MSRGEGRQKECVRSQGNQMPAGTLVALFKKCPRKRKESSQRALVLGRKNCAASFKLFPKNRWIFIAIMKFRVTIRVDAKPRCLILDRMISVPGNTVGNKTPTEVIS